MQSTDEENEQLQSICARHRNRGIELLDELEEMSDRYEELAKSSPQVLRSYDRRPSLFFLYPLPMCHQDLEEGGRNDQRALMAKDRPTKHVEGKTKPSANLAAVEVQLAGVDSKLVISLE